ncbi:hypothetical protein JCM10212_005062 [Sporobolomyces blumeae]
MTSRQIPIASNHRTPAQPAPTPFRSSLDLVFSFSRSAGFFGENLPSGPSFVDAERYRPAGYGLDDEDDSIGPASGHERETTTASEDRDDTLTDGGESYAEDEDAAWRVDGLAGEDAPGVPSGTTRGRGPAGEQLPRNAVAGRTNVSSRRQSPTKVSISAGQSPTAPQSILAQSRQRPASPPPLPGFGPASQPLRPQWQGSRATERTPLMAPQSAPNPSYLGHSPPDSVPFPRRTAAVDAALANHHALNGRKGSHGSRATSRRRGSTFSREAWKAAIEEHRGESTWGQTLFNTVNVLVGVGLLADPLAFAYGGWVLGTLLLLFCALVTNYTAKMLASLMRLDPTQHTYADVLIKAFGPRSRRWIYALFVVELGTFSVAAIELFADSLASLFPKVSATVFKIASYAIIVPTTFLPLRLLSLTSLLGILSSVVLLAVIVADGTIKQHAPGSLWDPMPTNAGPNWSRLPICFGLMMSGFSGHAVVPSLYRDMKNPQHFGSMINVAYVIAFSVSLLFAVLGYLMFGNSVSAEVTKDLAKTQGYPIALTKVAVWMVAINPLVKYAVANKPLVTTFEHLIGLHPLAAAAAAEQAAPTRPPMTSAISTSSSESGLLASGISIDRRRSSPVASRASLRPSHSELAAQSRRTQRIRYWILRPVLSVLFVLVAIAIPDFDRVLSFLGSASAFVICCIGPIGAYLILSTPGMGKGGSRAREENGYKKVSTPTMTPTTAGDAPIASTPLLVSDVEAIESPTTAQRHLIEGIGHELVVGRAERAVCWVLLVVSIVMATVGTIWSFLPEF